MGHIAEHRPVLFLLAAFSRHAAALDWAAERARSMWGSTALASERFAFTETSYYEPTMGAGILKQFFAPTRFIDPAELPAIKHLTNAWEAEYAASAPSPETRPLNLDPGYMTLAKLVLASTKDHAHRIYLGQGIFAEVTLYYKDRRWQPHPWTFPDYRREDYAKFFEQCRDLVKAGRGEETADRERGTA